MPCHRQPDGNRVHRNLLRIGFDFGAGFRGRERMTRWHYLQSSVLGSVGGVGLLLAAPQLAIAQASPFLTGATALQTNILAWLTPIAVILVMALGAMAMANRMSWGWCIGAILGIAIAFGAPQIVTWVRGMFGV
jgi:type IV secretion system protein VirB2